MHTSAEHAAGFFASRNIFIGDVAVLDWSNWQMAGEETPGLSFSGSVLFPLTSLDVIWCFCSDRALYRTHLYGLGKK